MHHSEPLQVFTKFMSVCSLFISVLVCYLDAYVSCGLFHKRVSYQKDTTQRVQSSGTVVFNYTFSFSVTHVEARESSVLLQLKDTSQPHPERLVGRVILGCNGLTDDAIQHVTKALDNPDREFHQQHMLFKEW